VTPPTHDALSAVAGIDTAAPPPIPLVALGGTGLLVSRIGLGLAGLGRPAYMTLGRDADLGPDRSVAAMKRRTFDMLDAAYAAGVRYVDVARSYGLAEMFVRSWLDAHALAHPSLVVGSKWGYIYTAAWQIDARCHESKNLSLTTLRRQVCESRGVLGSWLAMYQIHSATVESGVLDDDDVLIELARLRENGLCIGLTVTGPQQAHAIRRAIGIRIDGVRLFDTIQATWNLLEPSAGEALADAHAVGCGVIVKEALANGRLTSRYGGAELRELRARAAALDTTVETVVMATTLARPWADVVLSGAVSCDQLEAHVAAIEIDPGELFETIAEPAAAYWRRRTQLPWT
jgi:aryl-alcohol dehydrogenase-like predicted oxidoreductase